MSEASIGGRITRAGAQGTVEWLGSEYVGVRFDDGRKALIRRDALDADAQRDPRAAAASDGNKRAGPATTFVLQDAPDQGHGMGARWPPFFDDPTAAVIKHLPEILPAMRMHGGYSEFFKPRSPVPPIGPPAFLLFAGSRRLPGDAGRVVHPGVDPREIESSAAHNGLACVNRINLDSRAAELASLFPMTLYGRQNRIRLRRIHLWRSGVEAQIEADVGEGSITFFDTDFVCNQVWYTEGAEHDFLLAGIADDAGPADPNDFAIPRNESYFDAMLWLTGESQRPDDGSMVERFDMRGMALLLPRAQGDRDDYIFRGPIREVRLEVMLGQPVWRLRVTVLRAGDADIDIDVIVTRKVWRSDHAPHVGDDIQGSLWLQGRMWMQGGR